MAARSAAALPVDLSGLLTVVRSHTCFVGFSELIIASAIYILAGQCYEPCLVCLVVSWITQLWVDFRDN